MNGRKASKKQHDEFLAKLEEGCSITSACAAVGLSRRWWYWQVKFDTDRQFVQLCEAAINGAVATAAQDALLVALERADVRAIIFALCNRLPEKFSNKHYLETKSELNVTVKDRSEVISRIAELNGIIGGNGGEG